MLHEIEYKDAHEQLLKALVGMKQSIDNYKAKDSHNPDWVKQREAWLITIATYAKVCQRTFEQLQYEGRESYLRGFQKGKEYMEKEQANKQEQITKGLTKEDLRQESINRAKNTWHELF